MEGLGDQVATPASIPGQIIFQTYLRHQETEPTNVVYQEEEDRLRPDAVCAANGKETASLGGKRRARSQEYLEAHSALSLERHGCAHPCDT